MTTLQDQLRQDAASLQKFVTSVSDPCERRSGTATYLEPSERLFSYIIKFAESTCSHLTLSLLKHVDPQNLLDLRKDIRIFRAGWKFMHQFVKSALDADTLRLPSSLVLGLTARFREISGFSDTEFVIYHTDKFNYLNISLSKLKKDANGMSSLVGGPSFPDKLGMIGIPYSQSSSIFMNCLIPHEMGHHVFGELHLERFFQIQIEQELVSRLGTSRPQIVELLASWAEEIFCDLFAVRLVGFCFCLAFVELYDVSMVLDENSAYSPRRSVGLTEFKEYPPDLFRLRQQVSVLKQDKWWPYVQQIDSHYVRTLEAAGELKEQNFKMQNYFNTDPGIILAAFFSIVPKISDKLDEITKGLMLGTDEWQKNDQDISLYLQHGIVPSSIRPMGSADDFVHPKPVSLLNASYKFYLERLNLLITNIDGAKVDNKEDRVKWAKKVEMWTAKAIEDVMLMTGGFS